MCGIVAIYDIPKKPIDPCMVSSMTRALAHRGPDDEGFWCCQTETADWAMFSGEDSTEGIRKRYPHIASAEKNYNLCFGHRRLSIIELSEAGHQPMGNQDGTLWIIYNGEIYNFPEIKEELKAKGYKFQSNSDTEVILHAYEEWGIECLERFNGMWAFALWDARKQRLFCARDRFGIKPLYYYFDGRRLILASEIKAILQDRSVPREPNEQMIYDYLVYGYLDHTEGTFFRGIGQLPPAHYLLIRDGHLEIKRYWDLDPNRKPFPCLDGTDGAYARHFYELFEDAIRLRLRSDVPIGTCLSGGLDSSSIVCAANRLMFSGDGMDSSVVGDRQKTFSACSDIEEYDERPFIKPVLASTGAEANFVFPAGEDVFDMISDVIWHQDEPFGSLSIFAQWHVMKLAKERGVKVLLDGQGGDELLAGYVPYYSYYLLDLAKRGRLVRLGREIGAYASLHDRSRLSTVAKAITINLPPGLKLAVKKLLSYPDVAALEPDFAARRRKDEHFPARFGDVLTDNLYRDVTVRNLPALLHYEDRNSMAFSIEARVPFLDYRLVEYLFSLPADQKVREGFTKVILREAMKGILPEEVRQRTDKMGFVTPQDVWFRTVARG
ncbi:MAG: asparagine synthase (glutamine-hydrolyzing), partial [Chloroflexi bacterium]|nr:asparagine synthase (glutamine-hydrolyzing) [Chloroflexota bacterium]